MQSLLQRRRGLTVLLLLFLSTIPFTAQSQIDTTQTYQLNEVIISASRWAESPQSVGRNVTVITSEELRNSAYYSVGELLGEQQSLHMVGDGQTPGSLQTMFLRNANSNHSVVMIDGVRISDPSTASNSIDLSELSLARVERIEIVRGSHSTLYGSSAIGGAVNIITRGASSRGFNGSISTRQGTFGDDTYSATNRLDLNYSAESGLYADIGIFQEKVNGLDATVDTLANPTGINPEEQDDFRKVDIAGKVGYNTDRFELFASYRNEDQTSDIDETAYQDARDAQTYFNRDLYSYGMSFALSENMELEYKGAYSDLTRDVLYDSSIVNNTGNYDGNYTENNYGGTLWENELTTRWEGETITAIIGIGNTRQTMDTNTYTYIGSFGYESETDLDSLDLRESISNAFVHTELNGGLISSALEFFSLGLGTRLVNHNQFGTHLTYEFNPKLQVSPSALVYGAITTGYNAPSLYQLHSPASAPGYATDRGNENLEAETSVSYEVGWKQSVGSLLQLNISLFQTNVDDVIEYVYLWNPDKEIENLSGGDYLGDTYMNASEQTVKGIEVGLETYLASNLTVGGNLSYTHSTLRFGPGNLDEQYTQGSHVQVYESGEFVTTEKEIGSLTRRPSISANIRASWQALEELRFSVNSRFVGARDDVFYSANLGPYGALGRSSVDGYNLTDFSVGLNINERFAVIGKIQNLFDTDYTEINGYRTKGRGFFVKAQYEL